MGGEGDLRRLGLYRPSEADRIAGAARGTTAWWMGGAQEVTFLDLLSVAAVTRLRVQRLAREMIRRAVDACAAVIGEPVPLASVRMTGMGREALADALARQGIDPPRARRMLKRALDPLLEQIDYEDGQEGLAQAWWPCGRTSGILIHPGYFLGQPILVHALVRTSTIRERFMAGETIDGLVRAIGVAPSAIEAALRFELAHGT